MTNMLHDGELIKKGWKETKDHLLFWVVTLIVVGAIVALSSVVSEQLEDSALASFLFTIVLVAFEIFITIGLMRVALVAADGKKPEFADLISGWDVFFPFLFGSILYGLVCLAGFFLFIIPGIIWGLKFQFVPWLILEKKERVFTAFERSAAMTKGLKWDLLGFGVVKAAVKLLGFLCLFVGIIFAIPINLIATAKLYKQLAK